MDRPASRALGQRFEELVSDVFRGQGFHVEHQPRATRRVPDLLIRSSTGATAVVEVKIYRSQTIPVAVLHQAASAVEATRQEFDVNKAILVIGSRPERCLLWDKNVHHRPTF